MLKVGQRAPEFTLPDHTGVDRNLTDFLHRGPLILYFYPADFTPGCTKEACELRDLQRDITNVGLQVVGISPQSSQSHSRFRDKHSLPFVLLSDEEKTVVKMYDVNGPLGFGVRKGNLFIVAGPHDPGRRPGRHCDRPAQGIRRKSHQIASGRERKKPPRAAQVRRCDRSWTRRLAISSRRSRHNAAPATFRPSSDCRRIARCKRQAWSEENRQFSRASPAGSTTPYWINSIKRASSIPQMSINSLRL